MTVSEQLVEVQKSLAEVKDMQKNLEEMVRVPSLFEQPMLIVIARAVLFVILVFLIKFFVNKSPKNTNFEKNIELEMAKRDLFFSKFSRNTFLFLTCIMAVLMIPDFTIPSIANFATIAALYLVLEDNFNRSSRIVKQLEKKNDTTQLIQVRQEKDERIVKLENKIDILEKYNADLRKDIESLKDNNQKKNSFSIFNVHK